MLTQLPDPVSYPISDDYDFSKLANLALLSVHRLAFRRVVQPPDGKLDMIIETRVQYLNQVNICHYIMIMLL